MRVLCLADAIQDYLNGVRVPFAAKVDDSNVRRSLPRDRVFFNPIANSSIVKNPLDLVKLTDGHGDIRPGSPVGRDPQALLSCGIGHRLILFDPLMRNYTRRGRHRPRASLDSSGFALAIADIALPFQ